MNHSSRISSTQRPTIQWEWQVLTQWQLIERQLVPGRTNLRFLLIGLRKASTLFQFAYPLVGWSGTTVHAFPSTNSSDATAIREEITKVGRHLRLFVPIEVLAVEADQLYDRHDAYDYVWVEEGAWPSSVERISALLRMVKERGWICFQPSVSSLGSNERPRPHGIHNLESFLKFLNCIGTVRRVWHLLFVQKSTSSPIVDEVALCRILHRSQYDPDFRRRLLEGLPLPTNSARLDTSATNLNLVFTEGAGPVEPGLELLSDSHTCVLPGAKWRNSHTRHSLLQALERIKHATGGNAGA